MIIIFIPNNKEETSIEINQDETLYNLLYSFLSKTNSIIEMNVSKITFLFSSKILNKPDNLQKSITSLKLKNNSSIKVIDTSDIIGGRFILNKINKIL